MSCRRGTGIARDQVGSDHRVHERVGSGAERVEARARHRVAGDHHRGSLVLDSVADAGVDRADGRWAPRSIRTPPSSNTTPSRCSRDVDRRLPGEVVVVGQPVGDVRAPARRAARRRRSCVPGGPITRSGAGAKVVTQRLVITSLRSVMWSLWRCVSTSAVSWLAVTADRRRPHEDTPAAVEQEGGAARADEGGRAGAERVDERAAGAEEGDLDHRHGSVIPTATMQRVLGSLRCRCRPDHPALAVVAPPRLARFRELLRLGRTMTDRRPTSRAGRSSSC